MFANFICFFQILYLVHTTEPALPEFPTFDTNEHAAYYIFDKTFTDLSYDDEAICDISPAMRELVDRMVNDPDAMCLDEETIYALLRDRIQDYRTRSYLYNTD
jgi:hypothetical protein